MVLLFFYCYFIHQQGKESEMNVNVIVWVSVDSIVDYWTRGYLGIPLVNYLIRVLICKNFLFNTKLNIMKDQVILEYSSPYLGRLNNNSSV